MLAQWKQRLNGLIFGDRSDCIRSVWYVPLLTMVILLKSLAALPRGAYIIDPGECGAAVVDACFKGFVSRTERRVCCIATAVCAVLYAVRSRRLLRNLTATCISRNDENEARRYLLHCNCTVFLEGAPTFGEEGASFCRLRGRLGNNARKIN